MHENISHARGQSRYIYCNRYDLTPSPVHRAIVELMRDRDAFAITTNVDHQFQLAGLEGERLFYTQGDYGLWQCSVPCHQRTYDNETAVRAMLESQGYVMGAEGSLAPASTMVRPWRRGSWKHGQF